MADSLIDRMHRMSPDLADGLLALGLTALGWVSIAVPQTFGGGGRPLPPAAEQFVHPQHTANPLSYVLLALVFVPLAFRRRMPLVVLTFVTIVAAVGQKLPGPPTPMFLAPLIALYTVGTLRDRRTLLVWGAATAAVLIFASTPSLSDTSFWPDIVRNVALVGVAGALGDATRNRRAYVAEVEQRAAEAERTRDEEARRRVDEERLRIARELHDVTAHSLSIIAVQSGAAAHVLDTDPGAARAALEAIRRTSKDALDELRAMLGVLRAADAPDAPLSPVPGLSRVDELVAPLLEAGFTVDLGVTGDLAEIPAVVEFSAYRIVQEAVTNIVRHAGVCNVRLRVSREHDALSVVVEDDGVTPSADAAVAAAGHGIAGMRERVAALGGTFEARPREGGGFRVAARLPVSDRGGAS